MFAFNECVSLTEINIPSTIKSIGQFTFQNCDSLVSVYLPENVGYINDGAFSDCDSLQEVTIANPDCWIFMGSGVIYNRTGDYSGDFYLYGGVIRGYEGSIAQEWAEGCGYTFVPLRDLNGKGTLSDPYQLGTLEDYQEFVYRVNSGNEPEACAVLTADISGVTEMVGTLEHGYRASYDWLGNSYSGTFDGNGHTLDVAINSAAGYDSVFCTVSGATVRNLKITGSVNGGMHCSGLVGLIHDKTTNLIENCVVSAKITTEASHCEGIVGHGYESNTTIRNCQFDGEIEGAISAVGGIYGWAHISGDHVVENCLENGTFTNCGGVDPICHSTGVTIKVNNCYRNSSSGKGEPVGEMTAEELAAALGSGWTVADGKAVPGIASGKTGLLGDINGDGTIDSTDASEILTEYAATQTGAEPSLDKSIADVNADGFVDSTDAASILSYYAFIMSGGVGSFPDFIASN